MSEFVTHDVKRFIVTKPEGFEFTPGQGVEVAINSPDWQDEGRPFTPTGLPDDRVLEFTIKKYPDHNGVTEQLHSLESGSELLLADVFGTIKYKGPGVFIAAGAGITPFLAIIRDQARQGSLGGSSLLFSNKTAADIIAEKELRFHFGDQAIFTCTEEETTSSQYQRQYIDKAFLQAHIDRFDQPFYVCGPPGFMESVNDALEALGADPDSLVFEN